MELFLPSEIARLVYGYLKNCKNKETADCFLKSSHLLSECYQMVKANRSFNTKINGYNLSDIVNIFGTMCSMVDKRLPEAYKSKTILEKLQFLLDINHNKLTKVDKCCETDFNVANKSVGHLANTQDRSTQTIINLKTNQSTIEVSKVQLFTKAISSSVETLHRSSKSIPAQWHNDQSKHQQIPITTSLNLVPTFSKENNSVVENVKLVDTFLKDHNMLENMSDSVIKAQKEKLNESLAVKKKIFSKKRKQLIEECGVKSKFGRMNSTFLKQSKTVNSAHKTNIIDEVLNQHSSKCQVKNRMKLPQVIEASSVVKEKAICNVPNSTLVHTKCKSINTTRRKNSLKRCLDLTSSQPKDCARNRTHSNVFCNTPIKYEKVVKEPLSSPSINLNDSRAINGYESIINTKNIKYQETSTKEIVGDENSTADTDKKIIKNKKPKSINRVNNLNHSELLLKEQNSIINDSIQSDKQNTEIIKSNTLIPQCKNQETKKSGNLNTSVKDNVQLKRKESYDELQNTSEHSTVNVFETSIPKQSNEYDTSKLSTPLPNASEHVKVSLTERPLKKVSRKTKCLNQVTSSLPRTRKNLKFDNKIVLTEQKNFKSSNISKVKSYWIQKYKENIQNKTKKFLKSQ